MKIRFFVFLAKLSKKAEEVIELKKEYYSYKKRAFWSIIWGFSRAGIYLMS